MAARSLLLLGVLVAIMLVCLEVAYPQELTETNGWSPLPPPHTHTDLSLSLSQHTVVISLLCSWIITYKPVVLS
jgi:hypothetical protein